jgi:Auxin responsive protein
VWDRPSASSKQFPYSSYGLNQFSYFLKEQPTLTMMNAKGLAQIGKKWQRLAAFGRNRLTLERRVAGGLTDPCTTQLAQKGHFVVYTVDGKRFEMPLDYLNNGIVDMIFKFSEEVLGHSAGGPITVACDGMLMEYLMDLVRRRVSEEVERAVVNLLFFPCQQACSLQSKLGAAGQQFVVC